MANSKKSDGMQKCVHSILVYNSDFEYEPPVQSYCVLEYHTAVDDRGRPIHQDENGNQWS